MAVQLALELDTSKDDWRLDEHTREVGRQGLAAARRALAESGLDKTDEDARPAAA